MLLAGATIRSVSRGVVGIALLQSLLAGAGFLVAGIPAAGVLAFVALLLSIVQIGPAILFLPIIIWSWTAMDTTKARIFTAYMVPVGLIDNVLRPVLMARGLATPMPVIVIGVIGGTIALGIVGSFFGPIVLSVAWVVLAAWLQEKAMSSRGEPIPSKGRTIQAEGDLQLTRATSAEPTWDRITVDVRLCLQHRTWLDGCETSSALCRFCCKSPLPLAANRDSRALR